MLLIALIAYLLGYRMDWSFPSVLVPLAVLFAYCAVIDRLPELLACARPESRTIASVGVDGSLVFELEEREVVAISELRGISMASCGLFSASARITMDTASGTREITTTITPRALYRFVHAISEQVGPAAANVR